MTMTPESPVPYRLTRVGVVMTPEPGNADEAEGVLNPASGRGPDGQLYLLPRLVAEGNVSRVGIARVDRRQASHGSIVQVDAADALGSLKVDQLHSAVGKAEQKRAFDQRRLFSHRRPTQYLAEQAGMKGDKLRIMISLQMLVPRVLMIAAVICERNCCDGRCSLFGGIVQVRQFCLDRCCRDYRQHQGQDADERMCRELGKVSTSESHW